MKKSNSKIGSKIAQLIFFCLLTTGYAFPFAYSVDEDKLGFEVEVVNLASETPSLSRLDVYVRIVYDEIQFIKARQDSFLAVYKMDINAVNTETQETTTHSFKDSVSLASMDEIDSVDKFFLNKISFNLAPGNYQVTIDVEDIETKIHGQVNSSVELKEFSDTEVQASNILFIDNITRDGSGKYVFQPRVSSLQNELSKILAYFEVYNIAKNDSFNVAYRVLSSEDSIFYEFNYVAASEGRITQNFIDVAGEKLPHGNYMLKVDITTADKEINLEKKFNWYLSGFPAKFSSIDDAIVVLKYLASKKEYKQLLKLKEAEKHNEFLKFWKRRDPTPLTAENELRDEYYARVVFANDHYHTLSKDGWQTDMGWVHVMLGSPDNIQSNPYNNSFYTRRLGKSVKAIEIWDYYQYNRQLVFYDTNGFGQYRLENPETLYEILKK